MKILLYLPAVSPWWFDNQIAPLIRHLERTAEIHVMVPPLWSGTGIGAEQLAGFADCEDISWHILDGDDHPRLRVSAVDRDDLIELVEAIDADITLCRSADFETPRRFPGIVKFVMEAGFPPFPGDRWIVFRDQPFDYGVMPPLHEGERETLTDGFASGWDRIRTRFDEESGGRRALLDRLGLPTDRPVVALPLEYEHEQNFFAIHRSIARRAADLVPAIAEELGEDVLLAVTDHPLNVLYCDRTALSESLAQLRDRVVMVEATPERERPTFDLAQTCAGMIFDNSKTIFAAGFFGTPIARTSSLETGSWMNATGDLAGFARAICEGKAIRPDEAGARAWFAFHVANNVLNLSHPDVDGRLIVDMIETPVDPLRWSAGLRRYADVHPELFQ